MRPIYSKGDHHGWNTRFENNDRYVMTYVFNVERNAGDVVILSAQDFAGPPFAVVELPVRVPFRFHGGWVPDQP
jgi:carotenoid cleavage dioxygenase-like enzyme